MIPERQASKLPDGGATESAISSTLRRRRGLYAAILTNQGSLGAPMVTGKATTG